MGHSYGNGEAGAAESGFVEAGLGLEAAEELLLVALDCHCFH
jgi:hypothetical protein